MSNSASSARAIPRPRRFAIISTCAGAWGGSEELWWRTAVALRADGATVNILKTGVDDDHPRVRQLREMACEVIDLERERAPRLWHLANTLTPARWEFEHTRRQIMRAAARLVIWRPDLVLISQGHNFDGMPLAHACRRLGVRYVLLSHKASDSWWPLDHLRDYWRTAFGHAVRALFVSERNLRLTEEQCGVDLPNAAIVRNPVGAGTNGPLDWPPMGEELRVACVGRLDVQEKGQDILLRVLADEKWRARRLRVSFYGEGRHSVGLRELAGRIGCTGVSFAGHVEQVDEVWREHHVLALPSRSEGLPLALLEAMLCGRPAVVTDVGGNAEAITDGVSGFLASAPTVGAFDEALERAWQRRADWSQMGRAAAVAARAIVPADAGRELADELQTIAGERGSARPGRR